MAKASKSAAAKTAKKSGGRGSVAQAAKGMSKGRKPGLSIKLDAEGLETMALLDQWGDRAKAVMAMIPYLAADYVRKFVQGKLPKSKGYDGYRKSLEVARIKGPNAYAIQIDTQSRYVKQVKPSVTTLEIQPRKRMAKPDKAVMVLAKYNPWTLDSIPFVPDKNVALVITKKATRKFVRKVTEDRNRDRGKWQRELGRVGYRGATKSKQFQMPKGSAVLPDVAMDALKLEFGLGGAKPKPAWRTAVASLIKQGMREFAKDRQHLIFPFTKLSYNVWRKWPVRTKHSLSSGQAKKYAAFQKKLGISV